MDVSIIVAVIAAVVAVAQGVLNWFTLSDVRKADATHKLTESAMRIVNELQEEIKILKCKVALLEEAVINRDGRIKELEDENESLRAEVAGLRQKLERLEASNGTK